jgi:hypothetical protein
MAVNTILVMAKATNTALVREVLPVRTGSLNEAVKQNLAFWRIKPKERPITQNKLN